MSIDFWYGDTKDDVTGGDAYFYPNEGIYRGNLYNKDGKCIGDYIATDSGEIEDLLPNIFGE